MDKLNINPCENTAAQGDFLVAALGESGCATSEFSHEPVMLAEVLSFLKGSIDEHGLPDRQGHEGTSTAPVIIDGTLGLGGYSEAILSTFPSVNVIGLDRDIEAIRIAERRLAPFGVVDPFPARGTAPFPARGTATSPASGRFRAVHTNFGEMASALNEILNTARLSDAENRLCRRDAAIKAFVFDLGVSNMQLTDADRGFSFQHDGPLDMRMNQSGNDRTAADIIAQSSADELADIFWKYGGERHSRRIASAIKAHIKRGGSMETTSDLVSLIRATLPEPVQRKMGGHPARRVFQALRIFINDELGEIESMLTSLPALASGGCSVVIVSYHSLEDRIVKHTFRAWEKEQKIGTVLTRHPLLPDTEETERNYKARSAKLRAFRFI